MPHLKREFRIRLLETICSNNIYYEVRIEGPDGLLCVFRSQDIDEIFFNIKEYL